MPQQQSPLLAWVTQALAAQGTPLAAPPDVIQARPWSTVYRVTTADGLCFAKATAGFAAHETALCVYLNDIAPDAAPALIAVHPQAPWMLMHDAGHRLRETLIATPDLTHWTALLPRYAALQQATTAHRARLLALGLPDRGLARLPALFDTLTDDATRYVFPGADALNDAEYARLRALAPTIEQVAAELAAHPIPEAINHGDLHDGNIFHTATGYAFYDWGDAAWAHPFLSLRTSFVSVETRFGLAEDAPELDHLRDAYLTAWDAYAALPDLRTAFGLARRLWAVGSMLSWDAAIAASADPTAYAHVLPALARELLDANAR